ncbi:MAG: hypothetical protein WCE95_03100 [Nitrososphaeraceae archaeon]
MQSKIIKLSFIVLIFAFSAITIGITSIEAIWPFDQIFSPQSPPQNNQTNSSSQSSGSPAGQHPY